MQLDEVKKVLKGLLVAVSGGMSVTDLVSDFRKMEGRDIPYREFNFNSVTQFLDSMPDTLSVSVCIEIIMCNRYHCFWFSLILSFQQFWFGICGNFGILSPEWQLSVQYGQLYIRPVISENVNHIAKMVNEQNPSRRSAR